MGDSDATAEKPKKSPIGMIVNLALIALAFGLLALIVYRNREKIQDVFTRKPDYRLLLAGIVIFQVSVMLTFVRWYALVRVIEPRFKLRSTFLLGFIGYVFNLVIPGAVGGDLIKAAYLVRMHIRKTQAVASMVIDRILGLMGLFVLASIAGVAAWGLATPVVQRLIVAAWVATGAGFLLLACIFGQVLTRLFPRAMPAPHSKLGTVVTELNTMSTTYRSRLDVVAFSLGLSVVGHSMNVFAFYLMGKMLYPAMTTTLGQHYLMTPLTLFTMAVPMPFGALGVSEGVADQLLGLVGHPSGALAMMSFRILMFCCGLTGAIVYLANLREVRGLTAAAQEIEHELIEGDLADEAPATA